MSNIIHSVQTELQKNSDAKTKASEKRFFKEKVKFYGVKTAVVNKIGNKFFKELKNKDKKEIFRLCELLLKSGYLEEAFIAYNWSFSCRKNFEEQDFFVFEKWVKKYVSNWAECDTHCNHTVGFMVEKYPELITNLTIWTQSENRWVKRASAVSLIVPAKHGKFLRDVFNISDKLMGDKDDLVQKGYGWLLKVASQKHQRQVFDYVQKNKHIMPRTALRYAIEKMPVNLRNICMTK